MKFLNERTQANEVLVRERKTKERSKLVSPESPARNTRGIRKDNVSDRDSESRASVSEGSEGMDTGLDGELDYGEQMELDGNAEREIDPLMDAAVFGWALNEAARRTPTQVPQNYSDRLGKVKRILLIMKRN